MNYPSHHQKEAELNYSQLINDVVNAISSRADFAPDFLNALKKSGNI